MSIPRFAHFHHYIDSDWYNLKHFLKYEYLQLLFAGILSLPYLLLERKHFLYSFLVCSYIIFLGLEFAHIYLFTAYPNTATYFTIFNTNYRESMEFFNDYLGTTLTLLLISYFGLIYLLNLLLKRLILKYIHDWSKRVYSYLNFALITLLPIAHYAGKLYPLSLTSLSIFEASASLNDYIKDRERLEQLSHLKISFDSLETTFDNNASHTHVIVIGESTSKHHMSLYGYGRKTTPLLELEDLMIVEDAIAPNAHTVQSLEKAFTFKNRKQPSLGLEQGSLLDIVNQTGFQTYWLSNQGFAGVNETPISIIANKADHMKFTNPMGQALIYDIVLLDLLDEALNNDIQNKVIFIHLMGTHITYKERYPNKFDYFNDKFYPEGLEWDEYAQEIINHYDNAILYNDYVVHSLIERLKEEKNTCTLTYFSDHGDEVYDFRHFHGHADVNPSKYMYEVPFVFWSNETYKNTYSYKLLTFSQNLGKKFRTENLIHFFQDVFGTYTDRYRPELSIMNKVYNSK